MKAWERFAAEFPADDDVTKYPPAQAGKSPLSQIFTLPQGEKVQQEGEVYVACPLGLSVPLRSVCQPSVLFYPRGPQFSVPGNVKAQRAKEAVARELESSVAGDLTHTKLVDVGDDGVDMAGWSDPEYWMTKKTLPALKVHRSLPLSCHLTCRACPIQSSPLLSSALLTTRRALMFLPTHRFSY